MSSSSEEMVLHATVRSVLSCLRYFLVFLSTVM